MSVSTDEFDFNDLTPVRIPVKVAGQEFVLKDPNTDATTRYRNAVLKSLKPGPDGTAVPGDSYADTEILLVHLCVYNIGDDPEKETRVPIHLIKTWPNKATKSLFRKARELGNLDPDEQTIESLERTITNLTEKLNKMKEDQQAAKNADEEGGGSVDTRPKS